MFRHHAGLGKVGSPLQPHSEGVEAGPPCCGLRVFLDTAGSIFAGDGGDDRRVEAAREEDTIGHIAHQLAPYGSFQPFADGFGAGGAVLHRIVFEPVADVVAGESRCRTPIVVSGQEGFVSCALPFEGLEFAGHHHLSVLVVPDI